ncbi:MAG: cytochrome c3 family protein [Planctomycetota bacterium]
MTVATDIPLERLGVASGAGEQFVVGNAPLYWGRQTVYERTGVQAGAPIEAETQAQGRFVVVDSAAVPGIAVGDRVVVDDGTAAEEYLTVGRIQTTDDGTGADLGTDDRLWFTTALRYVHSAGAQVAEVTLTAKREGIAYDIADTAAGTLTLIAGQFGAGNTVVASYRSDGRFGFFRAPGDALQAIYPAAFFDSEDLDIANGDWRALDLVDGTYSVGMWAHKDFSVTVGSETTTYRSISPPAIGNFLFGAATQIETRAIADAAACNNCHDDLVFHGNGRRGLDTCLLCHSISGAEDAAKYNYSDWYVGATPGVTVDFRTMLHKMHMGKQLTKTYQVNGVFLGVPYQFDGNESADPVQPGGTAQCIACHGEASAAWQQPGARNHPTQQTQPLRGWRAVCGSCHDSDATAAHIDSNTAPSGFEGCAVCHEPGKQWPVDLMHRTH